MRFSDLKIDLNIKDNNGNTALHICSLPETDDYYGLLIAQHFITDLLLIIQKFTLKARFFNYLVTFVQINLTTKAPSQ